MQPSTTELAKSLELSQREYGDAALIFLKRVQRLHYQWFLPFSAYSSTGVGFSVRFRVFLVRGSMDGLSGAFHFCLLFCDDQFDRVAKAVEESGTNE